MRTVLIAPNFDRNTPGESWSTYKWVEGLSQRHETVVLTQHRPGWSAAGSPTSAVQVVNWTEPNLPGMTGRIAWELKPAYVFFYFRARRWLKKALAAGERFDLVHQVNPLALRYPSPARGLGLKYIVGPLAGSLPTPEAFRESAPEKQWYRKLRGIDRLRLSHDPMLRSTYAGAAAVVGVAPYVQELLSECPPKRFEVMAETGVEQIAPAPKTRNGTLRLLFVGRLIRTKGILEAIESVAAAAKHCAVSFDIVGTGDLAGTCEGLVRSLGLDGIVRLHGRLPKAEVFEWYRKSDVFLFPSYREPSGNVVFEALSQGLPTITTTVGGPGYVVTDACGLRVAPTSRLEFVNGLADAIVRLARDPSRYREMSEAALARMTEIALWPNKIQRMSELYGELVNDPFTAPLSR